MGGFGDPLWLSDKNLAPEDRRERKRGREERTGEGGERGEESQKVFQPLQGEADKRW